MVQKTSITITQLLKDPHSIFKMVESGQSLIVFSRSKPVFEIRKPNLSSKKKFTLPTISVPITSNLSRSEIYSENSWMDESK